MPAPARARTAALFMNVFAVRRRCPLAPAVSISLISSSVSSGLKLGQLTWSSRAYYNVPRSPDSRYPFIRQSFVLDLQSRVSGSPIVECTVKGRLRYNDNTLGLRPCHEDLIRRHVQTRSNLLKRLVEGTARLLSDRAMTFQISTNVNGNT